MADREQDQLEGTEFDFNADRYPTFAAVLARLREAEDLPDGQIERVEIHLFASGEASARVWTPRAEEPSVVYWSEV
jgi:hypothetical protein